MLDYALPPVGTVILWNGRCLARGHYHAIGDFFLDLAEGHIVWPSEIDGNFIEVFRIEPIQRTNRTTQSSEGLAVVGKKPDEPPLSAAK